MNAHSTIVPDDLSRLSEAELRKLENTIARKYSGKVPWIAVFWAFANMAKPASLQS